MHSSSGNGVVAADCESRRGRDHRYRNRAPDYVYRYLHRRHRGQGTQAARKTPAAHRQVRRRYLQHLLGRLSVGRPDHQSDARRQTPFRHHGRLSADREWREVSGDQEPAHGPVHGHRLQSQRSRQRNRRSGRFQLLQARGPDGEIDLDAGRQRLLGHAGQGFAGQKDAARKHRSQKSDASRRR